MILVTGANGQLGQCFRQAATHWPGQVFVFAGSQELDLSDRRAVRAFIKSWQSLQSLQDDKLRWVINCAAYTAVDKAESEPEKARKVNVLGTQNLAEACAEFGIPLVHFSTDYVYHNRQNTPFLETDPVSPKGVYARTKLAGERAALRAHPLSMIIRTSWVYSAFGQNFVKTMLRLGREHATLKVVADQIGSPTYAPDLADAVLSIIQKVESGEVPKESIAGIWHYANEGVASWYDFAAAIFELEKIPCRAYPIATKDYPTPARRPPFSVLDKSKIKAAFGLEIPHWRESLQQCLILLQTS
ncbi:MAG: dTDP-4-dehydrorhamnose reductase [Phycisphaerae bacterium]|nr:dTDP-4-dehydrorhamnose reductase [Saprospiraceae bacterium]